MDAPPFLEFEEAVARTLGDVAELAVVDIGAGSGRVTRRLAALGADVVGVEPNGAQVAHAREIGGGPRYLEASGDATGLEAGVFDLVFFSLSLHHMPDMPAAVDEAVRLVRRGGRLAVMEPMDADPIYPVVRYIDDERAVYEEAQSALRAAVASGALLSGVGLVYGAKHRADTPQTLLDEMIAVDSRRSLAESDRAPFEAAFDAAREEDALGGYIPYWLRLDVFTRV